MAQTGKASGRPVTRGLTLKDKLARLTFRQACSLLGSQGEQLIRSGGGYPIDIEQQVSLGDGIFQLDLPGATVTITLTGAAPQRLQWSCTRCPGACEHVGAALSLILEEKIALGLAAPPQEPTPIESLTDEEVLERALAERQERALAEQMTLESMAPDRIWADYVVTSAASGKTYRVALRGWERGESYCSCPDFRKNTLGTCKHIMSALARVKRRFPAAARGVAHQHRHIGVHLVYGRDLELRLVLPPELDDAADAEVRPIRDRAITDAHDLIARIRKLRTLGHEVTIYPDAEEHIDRLLFRERIATTVADIRKDPGSHRLRWELLQVELLPYQLDGIAFAVGAGRAVLADDMGLGKTIQAIGVAELLVREADIGKVLIVCPASLKSQWRSEIERFTGRGCRAVLGSAQERASQYGSDSLYTVCNYEQVLRDILAIERVPWDLIILDEGQRIKNWEAKTSRIMKGLRSPFALVLSGTPLENRLDDLYSVVEFVDERRLGPAFLFFNRHRVVDERGRVLGYKGLDEVRRILEPILLRRTRASVMAELPPRTTEVVRIAPTDEQAVLHIAHARIVQSIVRKRHLTEMDLLRLQKALLMCRMTADSTFLVDKQAPGYSSKLEELDRLLADLHDEEGRKILLFSEWTTMLGLIEPIADRHGIKYVRLDGSVPQVKRQSIVNAFCRDPECRLFITTNAGSTGLNLQAANTVVNVDLPWNPAVLEQRIARAHRMGQKEPVQVFVLVTEGTIEENLLGTLSAKHELALAVLDPESEVKSVDLESGMEELKRRLEVLLGGAPDAPVDESERRRVAQETERLARSQSVAAAGGQLLGAALTFLGEMLAQDATTGPSAHTTALVKQRLSECLETDESGRLKLTVTLPDASALDSLAESLGRLLGPAM